VKTLVSSHSEVKNGPPARAARPVGRPARRPGLRSAGLAAILALLILELSTGCGATSAKGSNAGQPGGITPHPGLVFITIVMIVVGVFILLHVGRLVGQIFDLATKLASAFASVMLVLAIAAGAVILAVFALAAG
jgi:hypothetical protein